MVVVVRVFSTDAGFSANSSVFDRRETAESHLRALWEDAYNELAAAGSVDEEASYFEDDYAVVTSTDGSSREFFITPVVYLESSLVFSKAIGCSGLRS